ncbi:unnamed protein product [Paramecium pentaurelia]|uniref:RRM domain-containing protein n=1 Tax=Paramecium pentaurelia TaxID=43138 RepID=A0A8S1TMG0_9CILI|nr:unnamed protein product [Paramecium pentaurelia]
MQEFMEESLQQKPITNGKQYELEKIICLENLDKEITENYLFCKFKEFGKVCRIKILKDQKTKLSTGKAFITFSNPESANKAIEIHSNKIFIKNIIKIKSFFSFRIFMHHLPQNADSKELQQEFSKYCTVQKLVINKDQNGKQQSYGFIQIEKKEDGINLINRSYKNPFIHKGKILKLEQYYYEPENKIESASVYFKDFAPPLPQHLIAQEKAISSFEYGWSLIIKEYLDDQAKDCYVHIDRVTRQPWAKITFLNIQFAEDNITKCNQLRTHPCFNSNALNALELIKKYGPPTDSDGSQAFQIQEIEQFFEEMYKDPFDIFKGESDNFFFNLVQSKEDEPDVRLLIIKNIQNNVTKEQISEFLGQFGKVIRLTIKINKGQNIQVQQCFVYYQTLQDSLRALSEIYDDSNSKSQQQKKEIFKDGRVVAKFLLPKNFKKRLMELQQKSSNLIADTNMQFSDLDEHMQFSDLDEPNQNTQLK